MKTVLAFETSSPILNVALGTRDGQVRSLCAQAPLQHSENLLPLIDRLLRKEKISLRQIDAFAIDRGPGSFTGLRIGFSLLKGFLAVRKRPCFGALSLDMMAAGIHLPEGSRLGIVIDARRDAFYTRFYRRRKKRWTAERKPELVSLKELKAQTNEKTHLMGDALIRHREALKETLGNRIHLLDPTPYPQARTLVQWFQSGDAHLSALKTPRDFLPLYFRASEAEEKRRKKIG